MEFIDAQFEAYLQEELKIKRTLHSYHDTRIHACLYFIAPTGHSLKSLDLVTMKKLDSKVSFTWIHSTYLSSYVLVITANLKAPYSIFAKLQSWCVFSILQERRLLENSVTEWLLYNQHGWTLLLLLPIRAQLSINPKQLCCSLQHFIYLLYNIF